MAKAVLVNNQVMFTGKLGGIICKISPSGKYYCYRAGKRNMRIHPYSDKEQAAKERFCALRKEAEEVLQDPKVREDYERLYKQKKRKCGFPQFVMSEISKAWRADGI